MTDPRDDFLSKVLKGKSFADVGGLWGIVNEKVSVAHSLGASALTMIDVAPSDNVLWQSFETRRRTLSLPQVECLSGDVVVLAADQSCPSYDVVHCSGVLYHAPHPMLVLAALRRLSRQYLILTSSITSSRVVSKAGILELPASSCLFIPALQGKERAILSSYWSQFVGEAALGLTKEIPNFELDDFGPWWWLPTVDALTAMCKAAGFHCLDGAYMWNHNAYTLLLATQR